MTRTSLALAAVALVAAIALPSSQLHAQSDSAAAKNPSATAGSAQRLSMTGVTVIRVDSVKSDSGITLNAVIASGNDSVTAEIGPVAFLTSKSMMLTAGDVIDIAGSTMTMAGKSSLIATEIKKGETTIVLRDKATGAPAWPQALRQP